MTEAGNSQKGLRWGILGAARIARKAVVPAIVAQGGHVAAVGASNRERAEAFARDLNIERAVEGYQAVLDDPAIDAVYIPLANGLHFRWALEVARAGKHCLCEKPMALNAGEAIELRETFKRMDCRLMEGFMWRHHPQAAWALERLRRGDLGQLRGIHGRFSFPLDRPDDYRWRDDQGGGAFWDLGCYCVNAMRFFYDTQPEAVSARSTPVSPGSQADRSTVGWLDFGQDRLGTFACSFDSAFEQTLQLVGTEGRLRLDRPFSSSNQPVEARLVINGEIETMAFDPVDTYLLMIEHFTRAVRDPSFSLRPAEDGVAQASVMEALAESHRGGERPVTDFIY